MNVRSFQVFVRLPKILVLSLFVFMSVLPPLAVWYVGRGKAVEALSAESRILSVAVSRFIGQNPDFWTLTPERLSHVLRGLTPEGYFLVISDLSGHVVLTLGERPGGLVVRDTEYLADRSEVVGLLELSDSLETVLWDAFFTAMLSLAVSGATALLLWSRVFQLMRDAALGVERNMRRFQELTELSNDGYFTTDAGLRIMSLAGGMDIVGVRMGEAGGPLLTDLPLGGESEARLHLSRALRKRERFRNVEVYLEAGDREQWILLSGEPLFDERGVFTGYQGTATDITGRKRAEEALRLAGDYNRSLIEASLDPLVTIGPGGKIADVNRAAEAATGRSRREIIGTDFSACFTDPAKARAGYQQVFRDGVVRDLELELLRADATATPVLYNASVYGNASGEVAGVLAAVRDIGARKKAEQALRQASAYHRSLIEASLDPLVTIGPDGTITDVNTATELATGHTRQELIGTDFSSYFTDPEKARAGYRHVFSDGSVRDYELELLHRSGTTTPVLYNASVYTNEAGEVVGIFAAARDITERKKAEELRDEIERIVQHDLRSPAGAAVSVARMLAGDERLDAETRNLLTHLERSGRMMLDTLNQTLNLHKITTGRYAYLPRRVDALELVRETAKALLVLPRFSGHGLTIRVNGAEAMDGARCHVQGDEGLLRMALRNVLQNALEASEPAEPVTVDLVRGEGWSIAIRNRGVVPAEIRERFFEKYATFGKNHGTGIGTYAAKMMIEAQGGAVAMRTSDETGQTVVTVHMSAFPEDHASRLPSPPQLD